MQVNELTSFTQPVTFTDEDGVPVTPDSGTYRIDDLTSGTAILGVTELPALTSEVDLEITTNQNRILNESEPFETRVITVQIVFDEDKGSTQELQYQVRNLQFLTTP